jgi:Kef-type K+ transport system membrane component KefB
MQLLAAATFGRHDLTVLFLSLSVLLALAWGLGELCRRLNQPAVLGEILAGIVLGPTLLGAVLPEWNAYLFPPQGPVATALESLTTLGIVLFLLVAGIEVDLSNVWRQGRAAAVVAIAGMVVPFGLGFGTASLLPELFRLHDSADPLVGALFMGTALSISALPVIAKILMDLHLYRSDLGMIVVAAAIVNDLVGWILFAILIGMMGHEAANGFSVTQTITGTILFVVLMLTVGRWLLDRSLPFMQAHLSWPGGIIGMTLAAALACAALMEWLGVHAIFGAFMFGVALGDSRHLREQTRGTLDQFISFFFAPLFFATIGLRVNFVTNFDWSLVLVVVAIATVGKVIGCGLGARWAGINKRQAWAIGFGMNARGAMEIVLGVLALQTGLIGQRLFVALVVMALITSVTSGSAIQRLLGRRKVVQLADLLVSSRFVQRLRATDRRSAIAELAALVTGSVPSDADSIEQRVWFRELRQPSGLGNGIATPHARVPGLKRPIVAVGLSESGIDFDARDGRPARIVCLLLTPFDRPDVQIDLLADLGQVFRDAKTAERASQVRNVTEFLAVLRSESRPPAPRMRLP